MNLHGKYQVAEVKSFFIMETNKWYTTKETKSLLKISDCKLMHLHLEGKIEYKKEGNSFYYLVLFK